MFQKQKQNLKSWLKAKQTIFFALFFLFSSGIIYFKGYPEALQATYSVIYGKQVVYSTVNKAEAKSEQEMTMEEWIINEAIERKLNPYEVWSILQCESRFKTDAININTNGTYDLGIWQWNSIHKKISTSCKLDYKCATNEAFNKRIKDGNWSAWTCAKLLEI